MADFQNPPTFALPILVNEQDPAKSIFNPIWLNWFYQLTDVLNSIGAGGGIPVSSIDITGGTAFQLLQVNGAVTGLQFTSVSNTYTPTLTNVANLDASTPYVTSYARLGAAVVVWGKVDVDPTIAATATQLGISLPITSNLANAQECGGTAFCPAVAGQGAAILGDTVNDRAQMEWISGDITNQPMYFVFGYQVI